MAFLEWVKKRGVLYALTQTPLLAILVGFFLKLSPYPIMIFSVLFSFIFLPVWISYRKSVSQDPTEPVHHLHKYAVWSLVPFTMFSLIRIPTHYLFGMAYWHPWYDFGSALTGQPVNQFSSLIPGAALYSIQGYSLTIGFYILFRSHSLLNALLYICVFDTSIYSFIFPAFARVGMPSPPRWHAVAWSAHAVMATTTWLMPKFWEKQWPKLNIRGRFVTYFLILVAVLTPYSFPFYRAVAWQFPLQQKIDRATFERAGFVRLQTLPRLLKTENEAQYGFTLQVGPRIYKNYVNRMKILDVKDIRISGRIKRLGQTVAWCHTYQGGLPGLTSDEVDSKSYPDKLRELDNVSILVTCYGPNGLASNSTKPTFSIEWDARVRLIGDREEAERQYGSKGERFVASNNFEEKE